ncbi:MAG: glycosyltransferase, partial [Actinobacteria bacterium]|nr:glycosyltransferase [Actinomycetota bacterium]
MSQLHGQLESMRPAETIGSQEVSADPAVTVVVAANDASSIRDALDSVRAQTSSSWECVVVDDASTDDTLHIVWRTIGRDPRFRVIRHRVRSGIPACWNTGLRVAHGAFVLFLESQDVLLKKSLEQHVERFAVSATDPTVV